MHSPEPWTTWRDDFIPDDELQLRDRDGTQLVSDCGLDAVNAARIVACVNALAGIPDPAAFMGHVREALRLFQSTKRAIYAGTIMADDPYINHLLRAAEILEGKP